MLSALPAPLDLQEQPLVSQFMMVIVSAHFNPARMSEIAIYARMNRNLYCAGYQIDRKEVSYSLQGNTATKIFRAFNALGTIAFSFGDAMLPEIQVRI